MKVLIPTADFPPIEGGISTLTLNLARELARLGHEVTVIAPRLGDMEAFDAGEPYRVERFGGYEWGPLRFFFLLRSSWRHARTTDLILAMNVSYGGALGRLAKGRLGVRYVAFAYAYEFLKFARNPVISMRLRAVYRDAAAIIAISEYTRARLIEFGAPPEKTVVIFPGARMPAPVPREKLEELRRRFTLGPGPILFSVGRLIPRKGHVTIVRALPAIAESFSSVRLVVAGQGPCREQIEAEAVALGVRDRVIFAGRVNEEELAGLYALCDLFVLPAGAGKRGQVEGFGLVYAEAAAHGKAVIAGRSGGAAEAVLDSETGLVIEPDDPVALAEAAVRILGDPEMAARMGDAGRRRVERELNWTVFTRRLLETVEREP